MSTSSADAKAQLAKILHNDEVLLATLSTPKFNTKELSRNMFQRCILSDDMKDLFTSLDYSRVDHQLQVRYLLRLVSEKVKNDESVWGKFLSLLDSMGEKQLCDHLEGNMTDDIASPKTKKPCLDIPLDKKDMDWLIEILVPVSHKWEHLGIALSLPTHELENCRRQDNKVSLSLVLSCWLSGCSNKTSPEVTLAKLKQALRSELVGEGRVAPKLEGREFQTTQIKKNLLQHESGTSSFFTIVNWSDQVEVTDNKSTLLYVQASPSESLTYQWNKDSQPLANDHIYSGVDDDILVVSHASQGTEGEYTCCVSSCERKVCSNKITLTVLYTPAKKQLLDLYSTHKEVPRDSWPPEGTKTFVNLVLSWSNCEHFSDYSAITNAEKYIAKKETVTYEQVFSKYVSKKFIFLEGRPGSGKTTLVHKIIKDWTRSKALREAKLVFIVTLRNLTLTNEISLQSLLRFYYPTDQEVKEFIFAIESAAGEGMCFIFDGLDEYKPQDKHKSVIYKLLDKTYLPLAMIIVASRPAAVECVRQDAITQKIEVFGFTRENIKEYIDKFPFKTRSSESKDTNTYSTNLKEYLLSHPNVLDMCYLPVHAAMICFLYNMEKGNLPSTQTKIYEKFTQSMILRHLKRYNRYIKVRSLEDLPSDTKKCFRNLCHLAFTMTVHSKQVVTQDEIDMQLSEDGSSEDASSDDGWSLGLVTVNKIVQLYGIDDTYSFLHLTFQEFMAAYYIATLDCKERMEKITNTELCKSMSTTVWKFYCGLVKLQDQHKTDLLLKTLNINDITCMHYAFESQQQAVCDEVLKRLGGYLVYSSLTPSDTSALSYVICTTSQPITTLMLATDHPDNTTKLLQQICCKNFGKLRDISISNIEDAGVYALSETFKSSPNLLKANLDFKRISTNGAKCVADSFKYITNLKKLHISFDPHSTGLATLLSGLQYHTKTELWLACVRFNMTVLTELGNGLWCLQNVNVHHIQLVFGSLCLEGATYFANGLHSCTQLETLEIVGCEVTEVKVCGILASALESCKKLKLLALREMKWDYDGATAFANNLHTLHSLERLVFEKNNIGPAGAASLADKLHCIPSLEILALSQNNIGPAGAVSLANGLRHLTRLRILDLTSNGIDLDSAITVLKALKYHENLDSVYFHAGRVYTPGIHVDGLVYPKDEAAITSLEAAIQHNTQDRELHLGFKTLKVLPRSLTKLNPIVNISVSPS